MSLPYRQSVETCFAEKIGDGGLAMDAFESRLAGCGGALDSLRAAYRDYTLPLLHLPDERDDLGRIAQVAGRFRHQFDDVVVLGTGGSSLGGQTLIRLADRGFGPPDGAPRLHFMDNVDPDTFDALFAALDASRTGFIAISKSGGTAETLAQLLLALEFIRDAHGEGAIAAQVCVISEPKDSVLTRLAARFGIECLAHDPKIGGRFSVLSLVGLLPAMIGGIDVEGVRHGAAQILKPVLDGAKPGDIAPAIGAAISVGLAETRAISQTVLLPYCDRLADFGLWYRQLWAESLGKDGKGTTPIRAIGTVDQHSQLQLYLGGPADKMFSVMLVEAAGQGGRIDPGLAADPDLAYLAGRTIGDLMDAEGRATADTLVNNGRPVRRFEIAHLDEVAMGALMMHFMLETIIAAHLIGVDPFDQPAVEEGKVLTRAYLAESGAGGGKDIG